jgi:hypothetical protein
MKVTSDGTRICPELAATAGQWVYVCCHCMVIIGSGIITGITYECGACHNTNLRFIHTLEHEDDGRQIQVGIECARALLSSGDWEIPALAENETKRKERWRREVYRKPGRCTTTVENLMERGKL